MKINIVAHPNSKRPRVEKDLLGTLHVYIKEPPLEGKANTAIALSIAQHFKVNKSEVLLISGDKSKYKVFEIS